jgi:hypothetical protein
MAASAGVDPLESAPEVAVLLLEHGDAGQELLDPRLEGGKGIAGLSQLGDYEADGEQESLTGAEEHGEDLLVVASTPDEGIEGVAGRVGGLRRQLCLASLSCRARGCLAEADRQDVEGRAQGPAAFARLGHEQSSRGEHPATRRPQARLQSRDNSQWGSSYAARASRPHEVVEAAGPPLRAASERKISALPVWTS